MHPQMIPVLSSNIDGYLYLSQKSVLLIAFKSGGTYAYEGVPNVVEMDFVKASSKGKFFQTDIKDKYVATKLDEMAVANLLGGLGPASAPAKPLRKKRTMTLAKLALRYPMLNAVF